MISDYKNYIMCKYDSLFTISYTNIFFIKFVSYCIFIIFTKIYTILQKKKNRFITNFDLSHMYVIHASVSHK